MSDNPKSKYLYAFAEFEGVGGPTVALTYRDEFEEEGWQSDHFEDDDYAYLELLFDGLIVELRETNLDYVKKDLRKLRRLLESHPDFAMDPSFNHYVNR